MSLEKLIANNLGISESEVTDEKSFVEDLGADSLSIVEIVMDIEQEFDLEIPDEDSESLTTVGILRQYISDNS